MKIFAAGMNYAAHKLELEGTIRRPEEPVVFLKPDSALLKDRKPFFVPDFMGRIDYEAEIVVRICRLGKGIPERFAHRYYDAVTLGIDFTARDMQHQASENGQPWTICKGFDGSAAIGQWLLLDGSLPDITHDALLAAEGARPIAFRLDLNGKTVQQATTADMLFKTNEIVSYLSRYFTLKTGDILYTGTPAGIGPVAVGDHLDGYIGERKVLDFNCR